ncbi:glycosyltransferase [Salinibacterium sp. SWN1162]|uniref:glycosyltransferase n=1 Tax=Salinibacterium sp. SWN1162 TaxID=2792053 RepID=UPI0018CD0B7A|nr:glycosyltransferase [Salinibacterium sp. SWN1162]MBH0008755.1 glycosyltransferase [Salinibacterium sp. SWN1162]
MDWLRGEHWEVDTVGPAGHHVPGVDTHYGLSDPPRWTRTTIGSMFIYTLLPHALKFSVLLERLIPREVSERIAAGEYDLILFNDHHFLPWVRNRKVFTPAVVERGIHLDIHEYVRPRVPRDSLWRVFAAPYYDWIRTHIGDRRFSTRSTVASGISDLYVDEFGIEPLTIVRNAPPYVELTASPVNPQRIELLYHGAASQVRGIPELLEAMKVLPERFHLTLILVGEQANIDSYVRTVEQHQLRVQFVDPAPVAEIAQHINPYDIEVMFYRPLNRNLEFALPNKLFEAFQARLAILIGPSAMMTGVIAEYGNGAVAAGWEVADLVAAIEQLDAESLAQMKQNSDRAAREISAETEREAFFRSFGGTTS